MIKIIVDVKKINHELMMQGITYGELSKITGISRTTIFRVTKKGDRVKPTTVGKIAKALNVKPEDLI